MTIPGKKQWEFTSFPETFLITSFSMSIGMIYPNPATDKWRLLAIPFALLSVSPVSVFISIEMLKLWNNGEILELMRHTAMFLPFFAGFMKMCLMYYRRVEAKKIIDIINHDYAYYNNLPDDYKAMVAASIKSSHIYINIWAACVMVIFAVFVGTASLLNIVSHLFMQEPKRYMIYDINMPGRDPEERFNSPYFEIMYFYTIYVALMYVLSFTGYDGLMIASVNHACLRQNIFTRQVQEAMGMRGERLRRKMADAVKDQVEALRLIDYVQTTFNIYLGYMYVIVLVEMVICIYLTNEVKLYCLIEFIIQNLVSAFVTITRLVELIYV
uniref:Odorant receptor 28 n=1 Tax=Conogethes punctiferalis TaxID=1133088 RepID=A0A1X9PBV9_CONPF|nr:odorant receptor 28 [Conogethes punctiferalis]